MKVIAVCASPRKNKNTEYALNKTLSTINEINKDIKTELISLAGKKIDPCIACGYCKDHFECSNKKDDFSEIVEQLKDNEIKAIIIGSPVFMGSMTAQAKAFMDRSVLFRRNNFYFRNKIGAAIAVGGSRNGGQELTIQAIHAGLLIHDMIVVGDAMGSAHFGGTGWERFPEGIENDELANDTFINLGKKIAELVVKL